MAASRDAASFSFSSAVSDPPSLPSREGPVLCLMNKRLRALKKKYNKILQIEESKSLGKAINKEQEEVLKSKLSVSVLIDEYEKLRLPLSIAVKEELAEREREIMATTTLKNGEEEGEAEAEDGEHDSQPQLQNEAIVVADEKDTEIIEQQASAEESEQRATSSLSLSTPDTEGSQGAASNAVSEQISSDVLERYISELLTFIYFAQLFDVRSQADTSHLFWTKVHERSSCLSYDCVTEDTPSPLTEGDLDDLSLFGLMITSRSPGMTLSHKDALQQCVKHAKLWLQSSDDSIMEGPGITYSHLKERLNRILSSEYYTMTPLLQEVSQQAAAIQYASRIFIHDASNTDGVMELKDAASSFHLQQQEIGSDQLMLYHGDEIDRSHSSTMTVEPSGSNEENQAVQEARKQPSSEIVQQEEVTTSEDFQLQEPPLESVKSDEHNPTVSSGPRGYQGPKASGRGYYGAGSRGRVRGNRGGLRGVYGNGAGRGGQYYDQGAYQPRNYYGRGVGRGGRGGYTTYNGNGNGHTSKAVANIPS